MFPSQWGIWFYAIVGKWGGSIQRAPFSHIYLCLVKSEPELLRWKQASLSMRWLGFILFCFSWLVRFFCCGLVCAFFPVVTIILLPYKHLKAEDRKVIPKQQKDVSFGCANAICKPPHQAVRSENSNTLEGEWDLSNQKRDLVPWLNFSNFLPMLLDYENQIIQAASSAQKMALLFEPWCHYHICTVPYVLQTR